MSIYNFSFLFWIIQLDGIYILSHFGSILLCNSNPDADRLDLVLFYGLYNQSRSDMCVAVILSRIINAVVRDHQQYDRVVKQQF